MKTPISNQYGKIVAWTETVGDKTYLTSKSGKLLGWYSESYDATFDAIGRRLGGGNSLGRLIVDD